MTRFVLIDELDGWLPREVVKHGSHDQKSHGNRSSGGGREITVTDNESAWSAVLTEEARAIDDRKGTFPERYNPRGTSGYGLKDGEIETRVISREGKPRVQDFETHSSAGLTMSEASAVEGFIGMGASGYGKPLVPVGAERPPQHVYRVMSTSEFDQARQRGYIKSDERMNVAAGEGTVASLRSTGSFYAPSDGSGYRVVRIKYEDADGWRTDPADGYIKTDGRVPFDRVDVYTSPVGVGAVAKHGSHDQASHGNWATGSGSMPSGWSRDSDEDRRAKLRETATWIPQGDPAKVEHYLDQIDRFDTFSGPNGMTLKIDKGASLPEGALEAQMDQLNKLQEIAPIRGMEVYISDKPFEGNQLPESVKGFVFIGESDIHLRPSAVTDGVDHANGGLMDVFTSQPNLYAVTHEYGHALDRRNPRSSKQDWENVMLASSGNVIGAGMRRYAYEGDAHGAKGREAFAEAWTDWVATGGSSSRPFVRYYAEKYGWTGGDGEPMSADLAKQEKRLILADTFTAEGAILVEVPVKKAVTVAFAPGLRPVLKHGSHDQSSHGNWSTGSRSDASIVGLAEERAGLGRALDKSVVGDDGFGYPRVGTGYTGARFDLHQVNPDGAAKVVQAQGWDAPSQSVDADTFARLAERDDVVVVWRGGPPGLEQGMINGTPYIGTGAVGPGTYVTENRTRAENFSKGSVVPMLMPKSMAQDAPRATRSWALDPLADHGMLGVGAVASDSWRGDYVVWNTGALIVGPPVLNNRAMSKQEDEYYRLVDGRAEPIEFDEDGRIIVLKHGDHDQKSHGNWSTGGGMDSGIAQSIVDRVRANGGLSVNMLDGSEPVTGYMVAKGGAKGAIVTADTFFDPQAGPEALSSFLKENRELSKGAYLGLWHNQADGKVYLDVSENIMDRDRAISEGRKRDQISIWDVVREEEIDTGGTGQVGKAVAGSETAGHDEDERRGDRRLRKDSVGAVRGGGIFVFFEPGLKPVLKHGDHDQKTHGNWAGTPLERVPGQFTAPGGGSMRSRTIEDEPQSRRQAGRTLGEEVESYQEAVARALLRNDFDALEEYYGSSRLARQLGEASARVERRIEKIAARVGIKRRKRWKYTAEQAERMRESYYEKYGRPRWMGKAVWPVLPMLKHGAHDQKTHGNWSTGGGGESGWGARQAEIDAMKNVGPSREQLIAGTQAYMDDYDLMERVREDYSEYLMDEARARVLREMDEEGWVDRSGDPDYEDPLMGNTFQQEFDERLPRYFEEELESYVQWNGDELREGYRGDQLDYDDFNEVFGATKSVTLADGTETVMGSTVENVYAEWDGGLRVTGHIYDIDRGDMVGEFERRFFTDDSGNLAVYHELLNIYDEDYQGKGFSKVFNRQAENYYLSRGITDIHVHAAMTVGGYAWASSGFDWRSGAGWSVKGSLRDALSAKLPGPVERKGRALLQRFELDTSDPDYPTPRELSMWGYVRGAKSWPGKNVLLGADWYGKKALSPSGPRRSTTQQREGEPGQEIPGQQVLPGMVF